MKDKMSCKANCSKNESKIKDLTTHEKAMLLVELEYQKAVKKHPDFPKSITGGQAIIVEEYLEFSQAINDFKEGFKNKDRQHIMEEAAQTITTLYRFIENMLD